MTTALLLIDFQNDYFPGGRMEVAGSPAASLEARKLLDVFRARALPVIHVQHVAARPGATFFLPGTPGAEIHANVTPLPVEPVVVKHFPNSFRETELLAMLREKGVERLVICGMMTHMCVDATVRAAFDLGFACTVVHDACATRNLVFNGVETPAPQVQAAFLAALAAVYGKVASAAEVALAAF
ncbi:MAG TPA: cysteine hydrolase family protein [Geobacteraceae bacterium]